MENIDVAKIMAEITLEAEKRYSDLALEIKRKKQCEVMMLDEEKILVEITNEAAPINGELCQSIKTNNHVLTGKLREIHEYGDIPWKTPDYGWKNVFLRIPLRLITKIISKLNRFITVRQKELDDTMTNSIELLQASALDTADWSLEIETRLRELTKTVKNLSDSLEGQRYMLRHLNESINTSIPDDIYLAFEEKYRGSQNDIEKQQRYYINNFINGKIDPNAIGMVVDLGCGRGEWLTLLLKNGYNGIGIDLNDISLQYCNANGVVTAKMDAVEYLKTLPRESVKLLTSFQLVEHISTNRLIELFAEIGRVMRPGGLVIIETPNPVNLNVGAASFYLDPTHKRQTHPELLRFFAEQNGLSDIEIVYWQQEDIEKWWESVWTKDTTNIADSNIYRAIEVTLKQSLWSPADYALIAKK